MATVVKWQSGMSFQVETRTGHTVVLDASTANGGDNGGPRPKEMVLAGLGGCTGMDVVSILRKMRQEWDRFEITMEAESRQEHPRVFTSVDMTYRIWGAVDPVKFLRAVTLSAEQYCPVSAMLRAAGVTITWRCEANDAPVEQAAP